MTRNQDTDVVDQEGHG